MSRKVFNIMLASKSGGLEQMGAVYTKALLDLGFEVHCLVVNNCSYIDEMQKFGAKIHVIKSRNAFNVLNAIKIIKLIKSHSPQYVFCHGNRAMSVILNRIARFFIKADFKTVGVMHKKKCDYKDRCDNLIFLTQTVYDQQADNIKNKSIVVPNTIFDASCPPVSLHNPITFGTMGRLHEVKGYDILLNSLSLLKNKGLNFKFVLAGTGPDQEKLLKQINDLGLQDVTTYIGWVKDKKVFFDMIDVFVLSSRYESFSLAMIEALAHSKAVVTTDCIGPKEIASNLKNPMVVPRENPEAQADKMEYFINNPKEVLQSAKDGNKLFNAKYSFNKFTENLSKFVNSNGEHNA